MDIHAFTLGSFQVSAYVLLHDGRALLIDAPEGSEKIIAFCEARNLVPDLLINTHGHADHIFANTLLKKRWPSMAIAVGAADAPMLKSPLRNLSALIAQWTKSPKPDRLLSGGDRIDLGSMHLEVIATPGHTPGGISLYAPQGPDGPPVVFTGDALFAGGIGRTDLPGMSHKTLLESIRRLLTLPPDTIVYPGHGPATTIGEEARSNPWLQPPA